MNAKILNREFKHPADGWYMIEPMGEHRNRAAGVVEVIDDEAIETIVNRFNADAEAGRLSHGSEMLIDHEHFAHELDQETRAYGWLGELQGREDGIYGRIRWTGTGQKAVDGGDYRFFSTEYDPGDLKVLNAEGAWKRVRPVRLDGLSLTNVPNNKGGRPITNREDLRRGAGAPAAGSKHNEERKCMKSVATRLGLSADASEEAVLAEVVKVMNRATELEGKVTPLEQRVKALEGENGTLLAEQVESDLAGHGVKEEKVLNRLRPVLAGLKCRAERVAFLQDVVAKPAKSEGRVLNRADTKYPRDGVAGATDQERANKIRNRAGELVRGGAAYDAAWAQATQEVDGQ